MACKRFGSSILLASTRQQARTQVIATMFWVHAFRPQRMQDILCDQSSHGIGQPSPRNPVLVDIKPLPAA